MDTIVSRQFLAFVSFSCSCLTRVPKSEEGPVVDWVDGKAFGSSGSGDLDLVLGTLFKVIVIAGFDISSLFRSQSS